MYQQLIPMSLVLALGVLWRYIEPANLPVRQVRGVLGTLVINLVAPALIAEVILTSALKEELFQIPASGNITILTALLLSLALSALLLRAGVITRAQAGALVLASAFGNGMGIALPAVTALFGAEQRDIPVVYDLLSTVPLVWVIGVLLSAHFGTRVLGGHLGRELLRMPPFWAMAISLALRYAGFMPPEAVLKALHLVGSAAVPLLLLMVGMTLHIGRNKHFLLLIPVIGIKLVLSAGLAFLVGGWVGLGGQALAATALTAAAPPVAVGVALCDRFRLDTELFGTAMTATTVLYVALIPWLVDWLARS